MNASNITARFVFPKSFKQYENDAFVPLLQKAFEQINMVDIVNTMRDVDHTVDLENKLMAIKSEVEQVRFMNSYRDEEVFSTTNKALVVATRKTLQAAVFKFDGYLTDFKMIVEAQMFLMKHTAAAEINEQTKTLNAFSQPISTHDILRAELAVDNMKALFQYFLSLQKSSAMHTVRTNLATISTIAPVISLGSKVYTKDDMADITWPVAIKF